MAEGSMGIVIFVIALLVVGGLVWLQRSVRRSIEKDLRTLATSSCPSCARVLGAQVAAAAREQYLTACDEARKAHPTLRINFAREWNVICWNCGAKLRFRFETGRLVANANL
jgi:hypothetical protein